MQNLRLLIGGITKYYGILYIIFANVFVGSLAMLPPHSRVLLVMISILLASFLAFVFKISVARNKRLSAQNRDTWAIFGLAVPACAACGIDAQFDRARQRPWFCRSKERSRCYQRCIPQFRGLSAQ